MTDFQIVTIVCKLTCFFLVNIFISSCHLGPWGHSLEIEPRWLECQASLDGCLVGCQVTVDNFQAFFWSYSFYYDIAGSVWMERYCVKPNWVKHSRELFPNNHLSKYRCRHVINEAGPEW